MIISMMTTDDDHLLCFVVCLCVQKLKKKQANGKTLNPKETARLEELKVRYCSSIYNIS